MTFDPAASVASDDGEPISPGFDSARAPLRCATSLDPADWSGLRAQGHRMLDDMIDHLEGLSGQPAWRPVPADARAVAREAVPVAPTDLASVHASFMDAILPYAGGNLHPGFMGWVQGAGTPVGMLAEMLSGGLNANLGGRNHMPILIERQIRDWVREIFAFPATADGLFLTGTSQANFVALLVARTRICGAAVRQVGVTKAPRLVAYASNEVHGCVPRALEMAGLGSDALTRVATDAAGRIDMGSLRAHIRADRAAGLTPFLLVGTAGTVNSGAIDDLDALADLAGEEDLHFHIDGALGALGMMSPEIAPLLHGIERADSLAFDFHKWGHVPYDAGFLLVREGIWLKETFASPAGYLTRAETGLAAGGDWPCDIGPDLSRSFRALKTWFTLKTYGTQALGAAMAANCQLARVLAARIAAEPDLELLAPVALNIVCFGYAPDGVGGDGAINRAIVEDLHNAGRVAPSLTLVKDRPAIRAAFVNHRTTADDLDALVEGVLRFGAGHSSRR
ncbi:pyridoxal phosphate-dependent decarboxylase family protein [Sphingomonas sp. TF3]|uniref:pyridoxal phosphate-dependent decarboxylase family protein n=2 Tax=unclassified Sphingomonas TaxID=196159 RepID=UPI001C8ECA0A|nr:pyridoxal-dependent decarboxylase [Sphingomonas sp. TF3]